MSESKHAPLPWVAGLDIPIAANNDPDPRLIWCDSLLVASTKTHWVSREQQEANAAFIELACNSHYKLLEACQTLVAAGTTRTDEALLGRAFIQALVAIREATKE